MSIFAELSTHRCTHVEVERAGQRKERGMKEAGRLRVHGFELRCGHKRGAGKKS